MPDLKAPCKFTKMVIRYLFFLALIAPIVCCVAGIWMGYDIGQQGVMQLYGSSDVMMYLVIILAVMLLVVTALGIFACVMAGKPSCLLTMCFNEMIGIAMKLPYTIVGGVVMIFFFGFGIALYGIQSKAGELLDEACAGDESGEGAQATFKNIITNVYSKADAFFCDNTLCPCQGSHAEFLAAGKTYDPAGKIKAQDCDGDHLIDLYNQLGLDNIYSVSNDDEKKDKVVGLIDYFGKIESEFECSGVCTKKDWYYFSDITKGLPPNSCKDDIKNKVLKYDVGNYGLGMLLIAAFVALPWLLHFPLYCLPGRGSATELVPCCKPLAKIPAANRI